MSGRLRELKTRIRSVENTKKITRAMELVAAAKLRKFQTLMLNARPYTQKTQEMLGRLSAASMTEPHPFFENREERTLGLVLMTSDSGLCGSYNLDLIQKAHRFLAEKKIPAVILGVGKFGILGLKRFGKAFQKEWTEIRPARFESLMQEMNQTLQNLFLQRSADSFYVVYSRSTTLSSYQPVIEKILPLEKPRTECLQSRDYLLEPSPEAVFKRLLPLYFEAKIRQVFLESVVSEQIARMTAMHAATENAEEMISSLVLERNKARQASITKEIIEIVSGSRALKR